MIQKSKSITATRKGNHIHWNGDTNLISDTEDMERFGLKIPQGKYRVTYKLDPKGPLKVFLLGMSDLPAIRPAGNSSMVAWAHVCFLSGLHWTGRRVSRTVKRIPS